MIVDRTTSKKHRSNKTDDFERLKQLYGGQSLVRDPAQASASLQSPIKSPKAYLKLDLDKIQANQAANQPLQFATGFQAGINYSIDLLKDSARKFSTRTEQDITTIPTERSIFGTKTSPRGVGPKTYGTISESSISQPNKVKTNSQSSAKQNKQQYDILKNSTSLKSPSKTYSSLHSKK